MLHPVLNGGAGGLDVEARLSEAEGLAAAIDLEVAEARPVPVRRPNPATLFGTGAVADLGRGIGDDRPDLVIVDAGLSPVQQRNLERAWNCKVIDRTGLILEIFGARARTHEGRLQVALAALTYQRSRLVRSWTHLERQRGGRGFLAGPGESQIESDRRQIDQRITRLRRQLDQVGRRRGLHRAARQRVPFPVVALVGYTNAGKSTLFNRLTGAAVVAEDKLFATLDPTMRAVALPSGRTVILSDTVGFISDLPTDLIAAFRATLEEVVAADVILHVRDIAHPERDRQKSDVEAVLRDLGVSCDERIVEVRNKIDQLEAGSPEINGHRLGDTHPIFVSALRGTGCDELLREIDRRLSNDHQIYRIDTSLSDGAALAWLHQHGQVLEQDRTDAVAHLTVALDPVAIERFRRRHPDAVAQPADTA